MSIVVWLISTAILWVVVVALTNATEAFVHNYDRAVPGLGAGVVQFGRRLIGAPWVRY